MPASDAAIVKRLRQLLEEVDLQTTSGGFFTALWTPQSSEIQSPDQSSIRMCNFIRRTDLFIWFVPILKLSSVCTVEKKLRQTLEAELDEDLSGRKALIREEVLDFIP